MIRLTLLLSCLAQPSDVESYLQPPRQLPWSSGLQHPGSSGEGCLLHFTPDAVLDGFVVDGQRLFFLNGPGTHDWIVDTGIDGQALAGWGESVLFTNAAGLQSLDYGTAAAPFDVALIRAGGGWTGVTRLRSADLDADGIEDLVGLGAGGTSLELLFANPLMNGQWIGDTTLPLLRAATDVEAVQWDGDSALEIAVLTGVGVYLYEQSGQLIQVLFKPAAESVIGNLVVLDTAQGGGRVAWMTTTGTDATIHVQSPVSSENTIIDLSGVVPVALTSANWDGDGDDELLLTRGDEPEVRRFDPLESSQPLDLLDGIRYPLHPQAGTAGTVTSPALCGDIDGDQDVDLVVPCDQGGIVEVCFGDRFDQDDLRLRVWAIPTPEFEYDTLSFQFDLLVPSGATDIEARLYYRESLEHPVDTESSLNSVHYFSLPVQPTEPVWVSLPVVLDPQAPDLFHFVMRPVVRNGSELVSAGPPWIAAFAGDIETYDELILQEGTGPNILCWDPPNLSGGHSDGTYNGGWSCLPGNGDIPQD